MQAGVDSKGSANSLPADWASWKWGIRYALGERHAALYWVLNEFSYGLYTSENTTAV